MCYKVVESHSNVSEVFEGVHRGVMGTVTVVLGQCLILRHTGCQREHSGLLVVALLWFTQELADRVEHLERFLLWVL